MKVLYEWAFEDSQTGSANPNGGRFDLTIRLSNSDKKWRVFITDEEIDEGPFETRKEAQLAAEAAYHSHYADYDE